jgi:hypothetical protein
MNKELFISLYNEKLPEVPYIATFCSEYPELMDSTPNEPEFLGSRISSNSMSHSKQDLVSESSGSIHHTISLASNLSRMDKDKVLCEEIFSKRKEHKVFLDMEQEENHDERIWYYIDDSNSKIIGPLTPLKMTEIFELDVLKTSTMIKKKYDEEYFALNIWVKRYFKNFLSEKLDLNKEHNALSNKVVRFKKGETFSKHRKQNEIFEPQARGDRFMSQAVRPLFGNNKILSVSEQEIENNETSRLRRNTDQP